MIAINNLSHTISGHTILNNISLSLPRGQVISLIGPSGAGKTSLIRCLNLLNMPSSGQIRFNEKQLQFPKPKKEDVKAIRQQTAMVFQHYALFINKTALENVTEGLVVARGVDPKEAQKLGDSLLKKVGLYEKRHFYPKDLSGGQQQRVGIARALALNTDVILFDEPTSALDPEIVGDILDLIKEIANDNQDKTIVIVTHEMQFAYDVSDQIVFMENGEIIETGSPQEILLTPKNPRIANFLRRVRYH